MLIKIGMILLILSPIFIMLYFLERKIDHNDPYTTGDKFNKMRSGSSRWGSL